MNNDTRSASAGGTIASAALSRSSLPVAVWIFLWLAALASRLAAAFLLPNAEQDGYSYAEMTARLAEKLRACSFHLTDLFGFWPPLFQFIAAIPNIWIHNGLVAGKLVSLVSGALTCLLVFGVTWRLTRNVGWACLAYALVLVNPLHILYSASSMSDVPHACLVIASLWFVLQRRWMMAAVCGMLAAGMRMEAWPLLILLPLIQFAVERRVTLPAVGILLIAPFGWLSICYLATGDPFAYFANHHRYQTDYMNFYPTRRGFSLNDVATDVRYFLIGANRVVVAAILVAAGLTLIQAVRRSAEFCWQRAAIASYGLVFLGFIAFVYLTRRQVVLFPRYGLAVFVIGLPLFAWIGQLIAQKLKPGWLGKAAVVGVIAVCLWEMKPELSVFPKIIGDFHAHRRIATAVAADFAKAGPGEWRCFSDDVAVRVLSGLPPNRFLHTDQIPPGAAETAGKFESFLLREHVGDAVFFKVENSVFAKLFPNLGSSNPDTGDFQLAAVAPSSFGPDVWLYRLPNSGSDR